ncbi:MAG: biotin transporter BioY [Beijerinckiaceae bacterium]
MAYQSAAEHNGPLVDRIWAVGDNPALRKIILAVVGAALLTLSAKIQIPFYPVPMTMQTLVIPLIGAAYGWRLGMTTVMLYLAQGMLGMPVFANTPPAVAGPAYFMGPTAGFLVGFVAFAGIVGFAVEKGAARSILGLTGVILLAKVVLFTLGGLWLAQYASLANGAVGIGFERTWGVIQGFLLGDLLKTGIAVALIAIFARKTAV